MINYLLSSIVILGVLTSISVAYFIVANLNDNKNYQPIQKTPVNASPKSSGNKTPSGTIVETIRDNLVKLLPGLYIKVMFVWHVFQVRPINRALEPF